MTRCPLWVINRHFFDVRFSLNDVRFTPESRHSRCKNKCPLWAKSGRHVGVTVLVMNKDEDTLKPKFRLRPLSPHA
jgi:hypothetical protein